MTNFKMTFGDVMLLVIGAIFVALVLNAVIIHNAKADEVDTGYTATDEACTPADYAHVEYADEYEFVCVGDTMEVWDAVTGEYITSELRCKANEVRAEDGSCVSPEFYAEGER